MKSCSRRLTDIYIGIMLFVFPLWTGFDGYAQITRWKFLFYAAVTCVWAILLVFFAVRERQAPALPRPFALLVLAGPVWAAVSAAASGFGARTLLGWNYDGLVPLALYALTALGVAGYGRLSETHVTLLAVSSTLCCAVAVLQLMGMNPFWLYPQGLDYYDAGVMYSGSFLGTMGNTNILGAFLCTSGALLAYSATTGGKKRLWLFAPALLCLAVLVLSRSEAGLVGLLAAALVGVPYRLYAGGGRRTWKIAAGCSAALVLCALAVLYFADFGSGTLWEAHEMLHGRVQDSFGSSRVAIWREALRLFEERPVMGGGPGTFGMRSALEFSRFIEETGATLTTRADNAHSSALTFLTELGVPGLLLWLGCWGYVFRRWLARSAPAAGLALVAYFVQSLLAIETCFVLPIVCILSGAAVQSPALPAAQYPGKKRGQKHVKNPVRKTCGR